MPLPSGYPTAVGYLTGTDGHGSFSSSFQLGDVLDAKGDTRAFTLTGSTFTLLAQPAGFDSAGAQAVNDAGDVLGALSDQDDPSKDVATRVVTPTRT